LQKPFHTQQSSMSHDAESHIPKQGPFHEYSVVYTDRVFNLMSPVFQEAMVTVSTELKACYKAAATVLIPGSGTFAMEAVARQFGLKKNVLVVRNGYFSYRWSDIMHVCDLPSHETVLQAKPVDAADARPQLTPPAIDAVVAAIKEQRPALVCAPHVETSTGIILSKDYIRALSAATHEVGGLLCIDGIAAGMVWMDMAELGVDVYVSAPQKGWTGPACVGIAMLSDAAVKVTKASQSNSFCCNLAQWLVVMEDYENKEKKGPGFKYYTTLPTDAIMQFRDRILETKKIGYEKTQANMEELGRRVRAELAQRGFKSVAADGWGAPGVVVVYSHIEAAVAKFKGAGLQIAGGVNWMLGQEKWASPIDPTTMTFRLGLFGIDKVQNVDECVARLTKAVDGILAAAAPKA
jgi:aspartate aminotransferase-like enzyme